MLRAEISFEDVEEVACAIELTEDSVFVISDLLPTVGTGLDLRLSFPHAIETIAIRASVAQVRIGSGPGTPTGFLASFDGAASEQREKIRHVVQRLVASTTTGTPKRDLRVLLVEDNRLVSDMFEYALQKYFVSRGNRVLLEHAGDVPTAWIKLRSDHFDLVIVDYFLPDEDGASLIERLRGDPRLATTSVVAISIGGSDVRRATLSAGADLFLHKPIVLRDLFHTLEFLTHEEAHDAGAA
ncbi:MAG: Chemotaxis protein CheY [Myxococcaceae bacterium]|nr:Chemotaxis protein CheY [Myxococcaceae bacterium]